MRELVIKAQNGDEQAREDLYKATRGIIIDLANKFHNLGPFEDLVSEGHICFMKALNSYSQKYQGKLQFSSYLYIVIENRYKQMHRVNNYGKRKRPKGCISLDHTFEDGEGQSVVDLVPSECNVPREALDDLLYNNIKQDLINFIKSKHYKETKETILIESLEDKSGAQIAREMNLTRSRVTKVIKEFRDTFRDDLVNIILR